MSYLNKEQLLSDVQQLVQNELTVEELIEAIRTAETVDAMPVHHAKWIKPRSSAIGGYLTCSICQNCYVEEEWVQGRKWKYCPDCGAKFEGVGSNGEMD